MSDTSGPSGFRHDRGKAELFELIVESSRDFAIFTTDLRGLVTSWNVGAERLFGFTEAEILGFSDDLIFTPEDRQAGIPDNERQHAVADGLGVDERWHQRNDGTQFWASGLMMPLATGGGYVKITRDRTEQHAAEQRLRENEERFRLLATSIPQLVFRTRPTGDRTWPSPQWIDFTGLDRERSLGFGWLDAVHPDDREVTRAAWADALQNGEYYAEQRVWSAKSEEYRWHQTRARPIASAQDDWVGTMTDVHEMRGLQERQHVLLAELQHRSRNLLAVVQAIAAQLRKKSGSLDSFGEAFESRLRALSRIQSLLAQTDHKQVDLRALVQLEIAAHADDAIERGRVVIDGPAALLPASSAQALALGIYELATNALKYGALKQPAGKLAVTWHLKTEGREPMVALEWIESGVRMPDSSQPRQYGYGTELIERALPYQLRARTRLEHGPDGIRCLFELPVYVDKQDGAHV